MNKKERIETRTPKGLRKRLKLGSERRLRHARYLVLIVAGHRDRTEAQT